MKVLITASTYPRYRGDTLPGFVHDFASHLVASPACEEVYVVVPHAEGIKQYEEMDGVKIHRFRYWFSEKGENITYGGAVEKMSKSPTYLLKLASLLFCQLFATYRISRRYKVSVINAHWLIPMGFTACLTKLVKRVPVLITIHGGDVFSLRSGVMAKLKTWSLKHADAVVVNSSATYQEAKKLYDAKEYPIIPMGVDVEELQPVEKQAKNDGDPLRLLFVGRLSEEKGVQYLIEAISHLVASGKKVQLTIAGSGPKEAFLKDQVHQHKLEDSITFVGWVAHDKFPELFSKNDVFVGPSIVSDKGWQEAFGLVFAESIALNTPAIGTTTGGIKDIIKDEKNGLLVSPRDANALAAAITRFIDSPDLVTKLTVGARDDIKKRFAWNVTMAGYVSIFENLVVSETKSPFVGQD